MGRTQTHLARTGAPWGSRLGLSITRAVANRLGGLLAFEREVERGLVAIVRGTCSSVEPG